MTNKYIPIAAILLLLTSEAHAQLPGVKLIVTGADPATGTIEASLFNSSETYLVEPELQQSGKVSEDGSFEAEFAGLLEGEYAIVVVHDANDNGIFDAGLFGFGGESVGFSNGASSWFGRPGFDDAKFVVEEAGQTITINLD